MRLPLVAPVRRTGQRPGPGVRPVGSVPRLTPVHGHRRDTSADGLRVTRSLRVGQGVPTLREGHTVDAVAEILGLVRDVRVRLRLRGVVEGRQESQAPAAPAGGPPSPVPASRGVWSPVPALVHGPLRASAEPLWGKRPTGARG